MRLYLVALLFVVSISVNYAQDINPYTLEPDLYRYYQSKNEVMENRIKYFIDSSEFIKPSNCRVIFYDTLGRFSGTSHEVLDSMPSYFTYLSKEDTLSRWAYNNDKSKLNRYEQFVYSESGKIIWHMERTNYHFTNESYYASIEEFVYDNMDSLLYKKHFYSSEFPGSINIKDNLSTSDLPFQDSIYLTYVESEEGNRMVVANHSGMDYSWGTIDTVWYHNDGRILKSKTHVDHGSLGCPLADDISRVTLYQYDADTVKKTRYTTYCRHSLVEGKCFDVVEYSRDIEDLIYNADGTLHSRYIYFRNGEKHLSNRYYYIYYPDR